MIDVAIQITELLQSEDFSIYNYVIRNLLLD